MKKLLLILFLLQSICFSKSYKLNGGTFDLDVFIFIETDTALLKKEIFNITNIEAIGSDFENRGLTFYNYGYPIVTWFPTYPEKDILNHELLHIVISILKWANIPLIEETEEVYTYEIQYLTKQLENVR